MLPLLSWTDISENTSVVIPILKMKESQNSMITIKAFLKFGKEKHIKDMYENGTIYINTIEYFRNIEDEELRGDKFEGASRVINSLPGIFTIPGLEGEFKYEKMHLMGVYEKVHGNIYSLYAISSKGFNNPLDFKIDLRNTRFGTSCLLIKNNELFFKLIKDELKKNNYSFDTGFVEYYDKDNESKDLTLFDKPLEFEYQKEFRFYVYNDTDQPIKLQLGSLKEIADIISMEDALTIALTPNNQELGSILKSTNVQVQRKTIL